MNPCMSIDEGIAEVDDYAKIPEKDYTPMMWAIRNNNSAMVKHLLEAGADINESDTAGGKILLMWAIRNNNSAMVKHLLNAGVDIKESDATGGKILLIWAIRNNNSAMVKHLLEAGADINESDATGWESLLTMAAQNNNSAMVEHLLRAKSAKTNATAPNTIDKRKEGADKAETTKQTEDILHQGHQSYVKYIHENDIDIVLPCLSRSQFSAVYRGKYRRSADIAIKMLYQSSGSGDTQLDEAELRILSSLRHPRILMLFGVVTDLNPIYGARLALVTEFMHRGSLYDALHSITTPKENRISTLSVKLRVLKDIADGMHFLHESRVIHRDLKSPNVLLDDYGRAKICDFGLSRELSLGVSYATGGMGTIQWASPESLNHDRGVVDRSTDVYSFGVIMWEVISGRIPWDGKNMFEISACLSREVGLPISLVKLICPECLTDLIQSCLLFDPNKRPLFTVIFGALSEMTHRYRDYPEEYCCPIGGNVMKDPVFCADGHTYDREHILKWFESSSISPNTGAVLENKTLTPNWTLKALIGELVARSENTEDVL